MASFRHEWLKVGKVTSKVVTYGAGLKSQPKKLVLIVTGNPGLASYYEEFMECLHKRTGGQFPVWTIGHAGHDASGRENEIPSRPANRHLFNLEGQIRHKIDFIKEYLPNDCELYLIGHSIGCKIILEVMKHFESDPLRFRSIKSGYLLFPTIERMYESPCGFFAWCQTAYLAPLIICLAWLLQLLPRFLLQSIVKFHLSGKGKDLHNCIIDSTTDLINPISVGNVLYMAYTELIHVRELEVETVTKFNAKLRFYFGSDDHWCPVHYYQEMIEKIPTVRAQLCERKIPHAFVLGYSAETAEEVSEWFKNDGFLN